jgi:hypothetical protein
MITKRDWLDWKSQETTRLLLQGLHEKREMLKEGLANGQSGEGNFEREIGRCIALQEAIEFILIGPEFEEEEETSQSGN